MPDNSAQLGGQVSKQRKYNVLILCRDVLHLLAGVRRSEDVKYVLRYDDWVRRSFLEVVWEIETIGAIGLVWPVMVESQRL